MSQAETPDLSKPSRLKRAGLVLGCLALGWGLLVALQIDDWGRDFTTNTAETSEEAANPSLRPLLTERSMEDVVTAVNAVAADLGWEAGEVVLLTAERKLSFVRTSKLFRFKDDVQVMISETAGKRTVNARSASRVGKGDLGQNPRTLADLLTRLRAKLGE